jgi:heme/copper-type cytochrome/quinol oxidase subunit 2
MMVGVATIIALMLIVAVVLGWVLVRYDMSKRDRDR